MIQVYPHVFIPKELRNVIRHVQGSKSEEFNIFHVLGACMHVTMSVSYMHGSLLNTLKLNLQKTL